MSNLYAEEELNKCSKQELITINLALQAQVEKLNENLESLIEQLRIANAQRFGRKTERLSEIAGQLSFFNEPEAYADDDAPEPDPDDVLPKKEKRKKQKGKRDEDLKDFPVETFDHDVPEDELNRAFGTGNWRQMPDETYKRLRYQPASWTVEVHNVKVYVGTGGDKQDEFLRGDRPKDLIRNSIVTPSLAAAIMNAKYVASLPLNRISEEFLRFGVDISRQTMSNWMITCANRYFRPLYNVLHEILLTYHVNQADETPVEVTKDGRPAGAQSYMWVHRSGEFYTERPIVLYEYQKTRHHEHPLAFYRDFKGILVSDSLQQYHLIERELPDLISANCWAHARRSFADAIKGIGKKDRETIKRSVAYQALTRIATIYKLEGTLRELSPEERLAARQETILPLVDEFFAWVKERVADTSVLPKGETAKGLNFCLNQEKYLRVFLTDGEVPIDNSASERSIRTFCIGKKNWVLIDSIRGAHASAIIYSLSETAKLNQLNPYYYFEHVLCELPKLMDKDGNIEREKLLPLLPWAEELPEKCRKKVRR